MICIKKKGRLKHYDSTKVCTGRKSSHEVVVSRPNGFSAKKNIWETWNILLPILLQPQIFFEKKKKKSCAKTWEERNFFQYRIWTFRFPPPTGVMKKEGTDTYIVMEKGWGGSRAGMNTYRNVRLHAYVPTYIWLKTLKNTKSSFYWLFTTAKSSSYFYNQKGIFFFFFF